MRSSLSSMARARSAVKTKLPLSTHTSTSFLPV
jgi:hypothetical protein